MSVKTYSAPWGRRIWLITGLVSSLGLVGAIIMPLVVPAEEAGARTAMWTVPLAVTAIIGGTALWMIRGFELSEDELIVRRVLWSNRIRLASIESAECDVQAFQGAFKTMGNDGLFAMHGRFRSKRLGKFQAYVTDPANAIVLKVPGDTIVVSPENPQSFLKELNRRRERLQEKH